MNTDGTFSYEHDGSETTSDSFSYKANDGTEDGNTITVSITINPVNDAPIISASDVSVNENISSAVTTITATDVDTSDTQTFSVSGTDAGEFNMNPSTGALTFITSPDFENPTDANTDNVYEITVTVTDGAGDNDSENITVTVLNLPETADFEIDDIDDVDINENVDYTSETPSLIDDAPVGVVTWSLSGVDAAVFSINSSTGVVSMTGKDFENPVDSDTDNRYEVTITATDEDENSASQSWNVNVENVIELVTFTIDDIDDVDIDENTDYTSVTPSLSGDAPIGTVSYSLSGPDAAVFSINSSTGVVTMTGQDFEN